MSATSYTAAVIVRGHQGARTVFESTELEAVPFPTHTAACRFPVEYRPEPCGTVRAEVHREGHGPAERAAEPRVRQALREQKRDSEPEKRKEVPVRVVLGLDRVNPHEPSDRKGHGIRRGTRTRVDEHDASEAGHARRPGPLQVDKAGVEGEARHRDRLEPAVDLPPRRKAQSVLESSCQAGEGQIQRSVQNACHSTGLAASGKETGPCEMQWWRTTPQIQSR